MRIPVALTAALALAAVAPASAAEAPIIVSAQANAPGWITINYTHSGDGGVTGFYIERKGAGIVFSTPAPIGQVTDAGLNPDTEYSYRACARFDDEDELQCSSFVSARTLPAQGKPGNFDPPLVKDVGLDMDRITVFWGPVGAYSIILLRLDDAKGNLGQWEAKSIANGSFTFKPLQPNTTYHVILKGCTHNVFAGHSCGPWSPRFTFTTFGPQPPPPPPGKPTLTVTGTAASTVSLAWQVKVHGSYPGDKAMLYRDGKEYTELEASSALDGLKGAYTDTVNERHAYQVCFERAAISVQVCSDRVRDPLIRSVNEAEIGASVVKEFDGDEAIESNVSVTGASLSGEDKAAASVGIGIGAAFFCTNYADEAVAAAADNAARKCGGTGGRWTSDRAAHLAWCEGLADRGPAQSEAAARAEALSKCVPPNLSAPKIKRF